MAQSLKSTETIMLLDAVDDGYGTTLYRVTTNRGTLGFLRVEDAKEYAGRLLTNGGRQRRGPAQGSLPGIATRTTSSAKKKREWVLDAFAKTAMSTRQLWELAKQSDDKEIASVPLGTWQGITSTLVAKRKVSVIGKSGQTAVYRTINR